MELSNQEIMLLDRIALHMISSKSFDIDSAIQAVRLQDSKLLCSIISLRDKVETIETADGEYDGQYALSRIRDKIAARVYTAHRKKPYKRLDLVDSSSLAKLDGGHGKEKSIRYLVNGQVAYVSLNDLRLHMDGKCKEGCPRCAFEMQQPV